AGVPARVAVPSPLSVKVTPLGSKFAGILSAAVGKPAVVTVNEPGLPTVNVVLLALVMAGAWFTVRVKGVGRASRRAIWAVMVKGKVDGWAPSLAGVPARVAVPSPLSVNVTPPGSTLAGMLSAAAGKPVVVTVNEPGLPTVNVVLLALVMTGAWFTVRVK